MTDLNDNVELDEKEQINFGDSGMGLADFCNVDVSDIEANEGGFEILPQGVYKWHVDSVKVGTVTRRNKDTNEEFRVPNIAVMFQIDEVISTNNFDGDEGSLINRKHTEFFSLPTFDGEQFTKAVGRLKAYALRINDRDKDYKYASVQQIVNDLASGVAFSAKIRYRKYNNKNGDEVTQDEIDIKTIKAE